MDKSDLMNFQERLNIPFHILTPLIMMIEERIYRIISSISQEGVETASWSIFGIE